MEDNNFDMDIDVTELFRDLKELNYITKEEYNFFLKNRVFKPSNELAIWIQFEMILFKWIRKELDELTERIETLENS